MCPLLFKQLIIPELIGKLCQDISQEVALYLIKRIFLTILSIKLIIIMGTNGRWLLGSNRYLLTRENSYNPSE